MQTNAAEVPSENTNQSSGAEQPPKKESAKAKTPHLTEVAKAHDSKPKSKPTASPAVASKPTKFLPSERITFSRQLDILRGWAAASGPLRKSVTNVEVAKIVDMQPSTVSMGNAFFGSVGLLIKTEGGYMPSEEVMAFLRAYDWNKETAAQKLAPVVAKSWFWEALASKLEFGPRSEADCLQDLGDAANAGQDYRNNLRMLLDYLLAVGLVVRDGSMIKKGSGNMATSPAPANTSSETAPPAPKQETQMPTSPAASMMPSLFGTTEGQVQFNIAVKVNMGEFATWQADRIAAFFGGIAQVLAAKAKIEKPE